MIWYVLFNQQDKWKIEDISNDYMTKHLGPMSWLPTPELSFLCWDFIGRQCFRKVPIPVPLTLGKPWKAINKLYRSGWPGIDIIIPCWQKTMLKPGQTWVEARVSIRYPQTGAFLINIDFHAPKYDEWLILGWFPGQNHSCIFQGHWKRLWLVASTSFERVTWCERTNEDDFTFQKWLFYDGHNMS